jgi:hypothetical protein
MRLGLRRFAFVWLFFLFVIIFEDLFLRHFFFLLYGQKTEDEQEMRFRERGDP